MKQDLVLLGSCSRCCARESTLLLRCQSLRARHSASGSASEHLCKLGQRRQRAPCNGSRQRCRSAAPVAKAAQGVDSATSKTDPQSQVRADLSDEGHLKEATVQSGAGLAAPDENTTAEGPAGAHAFPDKDICRLVATVFGCQF